MCKMKKKMFLSLTAALLALSASAQTNFRAISYDEAIAAAKAENKLVFMDFYTDWCGPCKRMAREVFPQKEVGDYMNAKFVCIKLNAEKEGKELADLYKVEAYPTFIGIDTDKKVVMTKVGATSTGKEFITDVDLQINPDKNPEKLKARYDGGERTPELIASYAALKLSEFRENRDMAKRKEAFSMVRDYYHGLSEADRLSPKNLFVYQEYVETPADEAARFMVEQRGKFDDSTRVEIDKVLSSLYRGHIYGYFGGTTPYDSAAYDMVKKDVLALGLDKEGKYATCFRFIECHAAGDMDAYLDLCEREYAKLPEDLQSTLMYNFAELVGKDAAARARAAKFVRSHLAGMKTGTVLFAAFQLQDLETQDSH